MIYGVTVGAGDLAKMALCQLRSIHKYTPLASHSIVANCPPDEWKQIPQDYREEISSLSGVHHEPLPLPNYPLSAFQATGKACSKKTSNNEWFVLLDTDTLVLDHVEEMFDPSYDLGLKPADFHPERVGLSSDYLREAYNITGVEFPNLKYKSTVDNKTIPPYWNGGVVFISDETIIDRWCDLNDILIEEFPEEFFIEQLSLSIISNEYETQELTEKVNFPVSQRLWVPNSVKILHYHSPIELRWVLNPTIYKKLTAIGVFDVLDMGTVLQQSKRFGINFARLRLRL